MINVASFSRYVNWTSFARIEGKIRPEKYTTYSRITLIREITLSWEKLVNPFAKYFLSLLSARYAKLFAPIPIFLIKKKIISMCTKNIQRNDEFLLYFIFIY